MSLEANEGEEPAAVRNLVRAAALWVAARQEATIARAQGDREAAVRARGAMRFSHDLLTRALEQWEPDAERGQ